MADVTAKFDLSEVNTVDAIFKIDAAGTTWGSIDGTLSNQTDLQSALDLKADKSTVDTDLETLNDTITENYDTLDSKIDSVQSDLSENISALSETVINNNTAINNRVDGIVDSFDSDIEGINTDISNLETTVSNNYTTLNANIQNETAQRVGNDSLLQEGITNLAGNLNAEITNRETADNDLKAQIDTKQDILIEGIGVEITNNTVSLSLIYESFTISDWNSENGLYTLTVETPYILGVFDSNRHSVWNVDNTPSIEGYTILTSIAPFEGYILKPAGVIGIEDEDNNEFTDEELAALIVNNWDEINTND